MDIIDLDAINCITQLKISQFIKNNNKMDKRNLVHDVEKMLNMRNELYTMDEIDLENILRKEKK